MSNHTTHFDDCGCKSAKYEAEIATLTRKLAYKQAECDRARAATQVVEDRWRKRHDRAYALAADYRIALNELEAMAAYLDDISDVASYKTDRARIILEGAKQ